MGIDFSEEVIFKLSPKAPAAVQPRDGAEGRASSGTRDVRDAAGDRSEARME